MKMGHIRIVETDIIIFFAAFLALEDKDWETALTIHRQLMTTEYERHGSFLLGLKRLIDLSEKVPSS